MKEKKKICPACGRKTLVETIGGWVCSSCPYRNLQQSLFPQEMVTHYK